MELEQWLRELQDRSLQARLREPRLSAQADVLWHHLRSGSLNRATQLLRRQGGQLLAPGLESADGDLQWKGVSLQRQLGLAEHLLQLNAGDLEPLLRSMKPKMIEHATMLSDSTMFALCSDELRVEAGRHWSREWSDSYDGHDEVVSDPFLLQQMPVTRLLWDWVLSADPKFQHGGFQRGVGVNWLEPVCQASWLDALLFCNRLSRLHGLHPAYQLPPEVELGINLSDLRAQRRQQNHLRQLSLSIKCLHGSDGYRLPTEAQWLRALCFVLLGSSGDLREQQRALVALSVDQLQRRLSQGGWFTLAAGTWEWCWDRHLPQRRRRHHNPEGGWGRGQTNRSLRGPVHLNQGELSSEMIMFRRTMDQPMAFRGSIRVVRPI